MRAPSLPFKIRGQTLELGGRPWLMGVVNATPDSFSDAGEHRTLDERLELSRALLDAGAQIIDIGGSRVRWVLDDSQDCGRSPRASFGANLDERIQPFQGQLLNTLALSRRDRFEPPDQLIRQFDV